MVFEISCAVAVTIPQQNRRAAISFILIII
jgi:hypothetical protein